MNKSSHFLLSVTFISLLALVNCQGKDCSECSNETDAMYGEERDETIENQKRNPPDNTSRGQNKSRKVEKSTENILDNPNDTPVNKLQNNTESESNGLNSSGENIVNKSSATTNPPGGSASASGTRGNSGQGRPY